MNVWTLLQEGIKPTMQSSKHVGVVLKSFSFSLPSYFIKHLALGQLFVVFST